MEIQFIYKEAIPLAGMSFYGDPFRQAEDWSADNEIGRLSSRYMKFRRKNTENLDPILFSDDFYEVHIYTDESSAKGFFEVFVGQILKSIQPVPLDLSIKVLPSGDYAVFNLVGEQIITDWYKDIDGLLKQNGWQRSNSYFFQVYDERFKGMQHIAESELSAYIPVEPVKP